MPTLIEALYTYQKAAFEKEQADEEFWRAQAAETERQNKCRRLKEALEQAERNLLHVAKKGAL